MQWETEMTLEEMKKAATESGITKEELADIRNRKEKKRKGRRSLTPKVARKMLHEKKWKSEAQQKFLGAVSSGAKGKRGGAVSKVQEKSMTEEDIDLKKDPKFRKKARKAIFGDKLSKGFFYGDNAEWCRKFSFTPLEVDSLKLCKERMQNDKKREQIEAKYPYDYKLNEVDRAKRNIERDKAMETVRKEEKALRLKLSDLEEKLIDHRIAEIEKNTKTETAHAKKLIAKKGIQAKKEDLRSRSPDKPVPGDNPSVSRGKDYTVKSGKKTTKQGTSFTMGEHLSQSARASAKQAKEKPGGVGAAPRKPGVTTKAKGFAFSLTDAEQAALGRMEDGLAKSEADVDEGLFGVANKGQMAMRVEMNPKCRACNHYDENVSACQIGMVPAVCGDGSYPEIGYAPAQPDRLAAKNQVRNKEDMVNTSAQASAGESVIMQDIPYRIEVLGDSALTLSERMTLMKSAMGAGTADAGKVGKAGKKKDERTAKDLSDDVGFPVMPESTVNLGKSKMALEEFADAMGTTLDVVRSIASKLGNRKDFAEFIKSKLPDIMMGHGLDQKGVTKLYHAAVKSLDSLTDHEWAQWQGLTFDEGVGDEDLARAIEQHGLLDGNVMDHQVAIMPAEPPQLMPDAEAISPQPNVPVMDGFVGGNLALADILSRRQ